MALEASLTVESRDSALAEFRRVCRSINDTQHFYWATWAQFHATWFGDYDMVPITPEKVEAVGAMLKRGKYRSAKHYNEAAKYKHLENGYTWSDGLVRAARRFEASITRGIGPGLQSEPLDFERLAHMDLPTEAPIENGPAGVPQVVI